MQYYSAKLKLINIIGYLNLYIITIRYFINFNLDTILIISWIKRFISGSNSYLVCLFTAKIYKYLIARVMGLDYCDPNPCGKNRICSNQGNGYICKCAANFTGKSCDEGTVICFILNKELV